MTDETTPQTPPAPEPAAEATPVTPETPATEAAPAAPAAEAAPVAPAAEAAPQPAAGPDPWAPPNPWAAPGAPQGPYDGSSPYGAPVLPLPVPRPPRDRKTVLRWVAAAAVLVATGAGTAVAVTLPDRTDVPGLATPNDGRYTFPTLALPPLPSGAAVPKEDNGRHRADLRALLLPAPKEAVGSPSAGNAGSAAAIPSASASAASASPSASASDSGSPSASATGSPVALPPVVGHWIPCDGEAVIAKDAQAAAAVVTENACRAAAAQGWVTKDGTRTQIRALRFGSKAEAKEMYDYISLVGTLNVPHSTASGRIDIPTVGTNQVTSRLSDDPVAASGAPTGRIGYLYAGDVLVVVEQTNSKGVPEQSYRQVMILQSSLLG